MNNKKPKKMDNITGYYIDLPTGANSIKVNDEDEVALDQYTGGTITPETETHYGLIEWGATPEITSVLINGNPVEVQPLIGGLHPPQRPK